MVIPTLIERKRDGGSLTPEEWRELVRAYTSPAECPTTRCRPC